MNILNNTHSAHCRGCKQRVGELLRAVYGSCRQNHSFPWSALPADYANSPSGALLERIQSALADFRGHRDFIKSRLVPPCDYYLSDPPFILEFDENQHFSRPRLITLSLYPNDLKFGFSVVRWQELCRELDARDDQPFDRDERRAWYDTLRDVVPGMHGFAPTIRLYAGAYPWCSLDPASASDRDQFFAWISDRVGAENR